MIGPRSRRPAPRRSSPSLSVVVSTYEWPEALDVVLRALSEQGDDDVEVVVADDGSGPSTARVVERWRHLFRERLRHVRQPDDGWRKARALNLGALEARGDYLVFLDGDSVPRCGFLGAVRRSALPGWFLAGKRLHLSPRLSRQVLEGRAAVWRWSVGRWLLGAPRELVTGPRETSRPGLLVPLRDRRRPWRPELADFRPPHDAYGFFLGVARRDFERVNGFDLRFVGWGGEDEDLAFRLQRSGLRCGWPGPRATLLHLWHPPRISTENRERVRSSRVGSHVVAEPGLRELAAEVGREPR